MQQVMPSREEIKEAIAPVYNQVFNYRNDPKNIIGQVIVFAIVEGKLTMVPVDYQRSTELFDSLAEFQPALTKAVGGGDTQVMEVKTGEAELLKVLDNAGLDVIVDFTIEMANNLLNQAQ